MSKGAYRVRFTHFGALHEGVIRPACNPRKMTLTTTGNVEKVNCHHCNLILEDFYDHMEKLKDKGELPDDFTGVGVRKRERRDTTGEVAPRRVYLNRAARRIKQALGGKGK